MARRATRREFLWWMFGAVGLLFGCGGAASSSASGEGGGDEGDSNQPLTWQEITANDRVVFPETVNRWAEHFFAGTTEAINAAKARGDYPEGLDEVVVFAEMVDAVRAVATIESHGDPNAISSDGALGIMQLMPKVGLTLNEGEDPSTLFDPQINIFRGCWFYSVLWFNAYKELTAWADLRAISTLAAVRYHGGGSMSPDGANWGCLTRSYAAKFTQVMEQGDTTLWISC